MKLEIAIGKCYKTRQDKLVSITGKSRPTARHIYPFEGSNDVVYMSNGKANQFAQSDLDLIEEVPTIAMFGSTWTFNNLKEEQTMQAQVTTLKCTLVISSADGELTLQTYPADEGWRESNVVTVLDTEFEVVLSKNQIEELYTKRLADRVQKADEVYQDAIEALETANDFFKNL